MNKYLSQLLPDEMCIIESVSAKPDMLRRFCDIGLIENTAVKCVGASPAYDPKAYLIRDAVIAIRSEDCNNILIRQVD